MSRNLSQLTDLAPDHTEYRSLPVRATPENGVYGITQLPDIKDACERDTYIKVLTPIESVCDCYINYSIYRGMPKSVFGDSFGYEMQYKIGDYMRDFYAGKISQDTVNRFFAECCSAMRIYRTEHCQTSGQNEKDNMQIVSEIYEVFAKENMRAAINANYLEGEKLNLSYGSKERDWVYYNSDYYYKCKDENRILRQNLEDMTVKWGLPPIDAQEIEDHSGFTLDGGFDFNSGWNFSFRNQVGRASIGKESSVPPRDFKMFFKERSYFNQNFGVHFFRVQLGKYEYAQEIRLEQDGVNGLIGNVGKLIQRIFPKTGNYQEYADFFNSLFIFEAWYSHRTNLINKFGDYEI